jgi:hypothetical protein
VLLVHYQKMLQAIQARRRVRFVVGALLLAALLFSGLVILLREPIPLHAGRPVNLWFDDLCTGVFGGTAKAKPFAAAYAAFQDIDPSAVPYLCQQLRYDRSGFLEMALPKLRKFKLTKGWADNVVWPSDRRSYAATALRRMGTKAEAAVPALLEVLVREKNIDVKVGAVAALESILRGKVTEDLRPAQFHALEAELIMVALRRHPELAQQLKFPALGGTNSTQFYHAGTNSVPTGALPKR